MGKPTQLLRKGNLGMTDIRREGLRTLVIERARLYKALVQQWEVSSHLDPAGSVERWKRVEAAERALFVALEALDAAAPPEAGPAE
jgi:hypothetical protein